MARASGSYPLCQGFESLHRHPFRGRIHLAVAVVALAASACGQDTDESITPEESVELARAKTNAADLLRQALTATDSSLSVRLRAVRGLAESGRIDQLRGALRELPVEQARLLVEQSVPNLTWLAMAGSVPDGRLRQPQVFAKDALLMLDEWMSPDVRRDARAVVVRWFVYDLPNRAAQGELPITRLDPAVRGDVASAATLRSARQWSDWPAITTLLLQIGMDADRRRLRQEAADEFVRVPFGTPEERAVARSGVLAALRGLSGDAAALKAGLQGHPLAQPDNRPLADLTGLRDALAAVIRASAETPARRVGALAKLEELGFALRPLGLDPVVVDGAVPAEVRAALAGALVGEGDAVSSAAATLATEPEVFAAVAGGLRYVKMTGEIQAFARALAAQADRLASLPGRCAAVVEALSTMGPRRSATAATLLLGADDPFIMSLGVEVLARVGAPEHAAAVTALQGSKARSVCWPDRTLGEQASRALEAISSRGAAGGATEAGDEDGG